jgi:predicted nucleotidyltransferase
VTPADVAIFGAFARDQGSSTTDVFRAHVTLLADI